MPDVLIRNFCTDDLALLGEQAAHLGISSTEFLRRHLHRQARRTAGSVTPDDVRAVAELLRGLADDSPRADAWS